MNVPFLDLKAQYARIRNEINPAIQEVLDSCAFAGGPFVDKFEQEWATYCGVKHAIGVGNGTDALWLALLSLEIGPGDEVITVPNTFIATAEAISLAGATPVFVDIDEKVYTMNPELLRAAITPRTKAIIPVHIFGQMGDMDPIMEIARAHGLRVIEDACQAHGATYKGRKAGSVGDAAAFSFYPGKNLGAYGEAGAVTTNSGEIAGKIRMLRDHGQRSKYFHQVIGTNGRMDGLQGAILSVKLKYLDAWNTARRAAAADYVRRLSAIDGLVLPTEALYARHVFHVFALRVRNRDKVIKDLMGLQIHCGIHYPVPIHLQNAYIEMRLRKGIFPVAEGCAEEIVSLPIFAELTGGQIEYVARSIAETLG
jgi:dTDP-4-amino-4,6-dideoxygalactose transaminase